MRYTHRIVRVTALACLLSGMLWFVLGHTQTVQAAVVVSDCTQQGLIDAMSSGSGNIGFDCGPAPVTIIITQNGGISTIPNSFYAIDGGNLVTLSGAHANRIFLIQFNSALTLTNITLTDGSALGGRGTGEYGGAIASEGRLLVLDHVIIRNSHSTFYGGAIEHYGTAIIINSLIENNDSAFGGGIDSNGTLILTNTIVRNNRANNFDGGGLEVTGAAVISNSQIYGNSARGDVFGTNMIVGGGGLSITALGRVSISGSRLDANKTPTTSTTFGGAILNRGILTVTQSTFSGNSASAGGGIFNQGVAMLNTSTFSGNAATQGGGLYNQFDAGLLNVTLSRNYAITGGALYMAGGYTTSLTNTVVAYSPSGGNCSGTPGVSIYSISSDNTCALAGLVKDMNPNGLDPLLTALGNYGGPTSVHMLKLHSPAIDGAVGHPSFAMDQRGLPRSMDGRYDIGAVERQPADSSLTPRLFLPVVAR